MADDVFFDEKLTKKERYQQLQNHAAALLSSENDLIANMANVAALLKQAFGFYWVGFYRFDGKELVLGPFQGPIACTRIALGRGVCGTSAAEQKTILVPDVEQFPGHIACSAFSKSEIVLPFFDQNQKMLGVLDIDSDKLNDFDETDQYELKQLLAFFAK